MTSDDPCRLYPQTPSIFVALEIGLLHRRMRRGRVQINRHSKRLGTFEDEPILRVVQESAAGVTVDHGAFEAEPRDRPIELVHRSGGVRRRQGGKTREAGGVCLDGLEQEIVDLPGHRDGGSGIECLAPRLVYAESTCRSMPAASMAAMRASPRSSNAATTSNSRSFSRSFPRWAPGKVLFLLRRDEVLLERDDLHRCHPAIAARSASGKGPRKPRRHRPR